MLQFDDKQYSSLQLMPAVTALLALALTGVLNLYGTAQAESSIIRIIAGIAAILSIFFLLLIFIPRLYKWIQLVFHKYVIKKRERELLLQLKELICGDLHHLFDTNYVYSIQSLVQKLTFGHIKYEDSEAHPRLRTITQKLSILSDWSDLLVESLEKPGVIHKQYKFQRTISDITRFHHALGKIIKEFMALNLTIEDPRHRNKDDETIAVEQYNNYVGRLEVLLSKGSKIGSSSPRQGFPRLWLD